MTAHVNIGFDVQSAPCSNAAVFEEIRTVLKRPDLSEDILREILAGERFSATEGLSADAFVLGLGTPKQRAGIIRTMMVPPPVHGLDMPAHDLNPPLSVRFAPAARFWQRKLLSARLYMKKTPALVRSR